MVFRVAISLLILSSSLLSIEGFAARPSLLGVPSQRIPTHLLSGQKEMAVTKNDNDDDSEERFTTDTEAYLASLAGQKLELGYQSEEAQLDVTIQPHSQIERNDAANDESSSNFAFLEEESEVEIPELAGSYMSIEDVESDEPMVYYSYMTTDEDDEVFETQKDTLIATIASHLSAEQKGTLARLAVAFAPSDQGMSLQHIEDVQVIGMDDQHIDIGAVVCEEEACVSVAVPVDFPSECEIEVLAECTMDNIAQLDTQATELIDTIEETSQQEATYNENRHVLVSEKLTALPGWWVASNELSESCDNLLVLLNQPDFNEEVKALATKAMDDIPGGDDFTVEQAMMTALCPTGMCLRAKVQPILFFDEDVESKLLELQLPFGFQAENFDQLRDTILSAVAEAAPYMAS